MLALDNVYDAENILRGVIRKTEMLYAPTLCPEVELYLKTENLQTTGSFKLRGAYYKITRLADEARSRGVVACSAGNHAQGVAFSSINTRRGSTSSPINIENILSASAAFSMVTCFKTLPCVYRRKCNLR